MEGWVQLDLADRRPKPSKAVQERIKGTVILHPGDNRVGNKAIDTIARIRAISGGEGAIILYSNCAGLLTEADSIEKMLEYARKIRGRLQGMPSTSIMNQDDGSAILWVDGCFFYAYTKGLGAFPSPLDAVLSLTEKCSQAVKKGEILAIVYCREADWHEKNENQ